MSQLEGHIIQELKAAILQSRYQAARLVNKELISLYFAIGEKISVNTKKLGWGSKVLEQVSQELQSELPGLKGFSATNLQRMNLVYDFWKDSFLIYPTLSGKLEMSVDEPNNPLSAAFFSVSFSHHYLIASKSKIRKHSRNY